MRHELHHGSAPDPGAASLSAGTHGDIVLTHALPDLSDELRPRHAAHFADDIEPRQPAAPNQIIPAARSRRGTRHVADLVLQAAADADAIVAESMKEPEGAGFERRLHRPGGAAQAGDPRDCVLAHAMRRTVARRAVEAGIEGDRRPVEELQAAYIKVDAPGHRSERERVRDEVEIEAAREHFGRETRPGTERIPQDDAAADDRATEHLGNQIAVERQLAIAITNQRNVTRERSGHDGP